MCGPHGQVTCNHTEEGSHATYSQAKYEYITHVHIQAMIIKMNSDIDNMLKDDQDNIQARKINTSSQTMYNSESMHVRLSEQS